MTQVVSTVRDPSTDPWHPDHRVRTANAVTAARALQAKHMATIDVLKRAVSGGKLSADEKSTASDFLAAMGDVLMKRSDLAYHIETNLPVAPSA